MVALGIFIKSFLYNSFLNIYEAYEHLSSDLLSSGNYMFFVVCF